VNKSTAFTKLKLLGFLRKYNLHCTHWKMGEFISPEEQLRRSIKYPTFQVTMPEGTSESKPLPKETRNEPPKSPSHRVCKTKRKPNPTHRTKKASPPARKASPEPVIKAEPQAADFRSFPSIAPKTSDAATQTERPQTPEKQPPQEPETSSPVKKRVRLRFRVNGKLLNRKRSRIHISTSPKKKEDQAYAALASSAGRDAGIPESDQGCTSK
jgi:hypothetical protein